jgi:hypothetical protein
MLKNPGPQPCNDLVKLELNGNQVILKGVEIRIKIEEYVIYDKINKKYIVDKKKNPITFSSKINATDYVKKHNIRDCEIRQYIVPKKIKIEA